jgi:hypothetical protein
MNDHRPTRADTANANETATKQENETMLALCPYTDSMAIRKIKTAKRIKNKGKG